ncbi:MAG TPA: Holliday junction branch migration protein RuvA [Tissierellaceae bacterium]|nr:Holliday junction branch migration protein RuvA [Tissierellaceae bacterium]
MFDFIIGDMVSIEDEYVVIQNNGIGYRVFVSANTMMNLQIGKRDQMLYTEFHVREDGVFLYGFVTKEEVNMFNSLLKVSKIGAKTALGVLSTLSPSKIKLAIINKDLDMLCQAPGIGKKTAERIVFELKDKIDTNIDIEDLGQIEVNPKSYDEALAGLMSLGYSRYEVDKAIRKLELDNMKVEEIIREGLKSLSKN